MQPNTCLANYSKIAHMKPPIMHCLTKALPGGTIAQSALSSPLYEKEIGLHNLYFLTNYVNSRHSPNLPYLGRKICKVMVCDYNIWYENIYC